MSTAKWITCKQTAGPAQCGAKYHPDDKDDFLEHLLAHGLTKADTREWWDEEGGFSISPEDRVGKATPLERSQFGDGSEQQLRENSRKWHELRELEKVSDHKTPASAFIGAHVISENQPRARAGALQPPKEGLSAGKPMPPAAHGVVEVLRPSVEKQQKKAGTRPARLVSSRKDKKNMAAKKDKYSAVEAVKIAGGDIAKVADRMVITTGRDFKDAAAIKSLMSVIQKNDPNVIITNQGRWEGDKLVASVARSIGLSYVETLPKFLEARNRGQAVIASDERMTVEWRHQRR